MRDLYEILEIETEVSLPQIKKAFRRLALKYHPDRVPEDQKKESGEKFKEIAQAYSVLSDFKKRSYYDKYGSIEGAPIILESVLQKFREGLDNTRNGERKSPAEYVKDMQEKKEEIDGKIVKECFICEGTGITQREKGFLIVEGRCESCKGLGYHVIWQREEVPVKPNKPLDFFSLFGLRE